VPQARIGVADLLLGALLVGVSAPVSAGGLFRQKVVVIRYAGATNEGGIVYRWSRPSR